MAINYFIPTLWEAATLERWEAQKVFPALLDRHYEGIATRGNTVKITAVTTPTITDYSAAGRVTSEEAISDTSVTLSIDQESSFDFFVDDIDQAQAAGSFVEWTNAAADGLVNEADQYIATNMVADGNVLAYSAISDAAGAFNVFALANKQLNINKVPAAGRVAVINPALEYYLLLSDAKLTSVSTSGDNEGLRNATLGKVLNFRTVVSTNLPESDSPQALFFHPSSTAYVSQLDRVEALRSNTRFADRIRGLHVYGYKMVRPTGCLVWNELGT
jgi:hypothetical protein